MLRKTVALLRKLVAAKVYEQMMQHFNLKEGDYENPNIRPFTRIEDWNFTALSNEGRKDYRDNNLPARDVPKYVFIGFERASHPKYLFDSRTELTFAFVLENARRVYKWLRPGENQLRL